MALALAALNSSSAGRCASVGCTTSEMRHFQTKVLSIPKDCCEKGTPCARRRALRGDMRGCYGRLPKKLAEGGEPPLNSAFLGAQADFCPRRPTAWRQAKPASC